MNTRHRLQDRHMQYTQSVFWNGTPWQVSGGFDGTDRGVREIFMSGPKDGTFLQKHMADVCILLSRTLQRGDSVKAINDDLLRLQEDERRAAQQSVEIEPLLPLAPEAVPDDPLFEPDRLGDITAVLVAMENELGGDLAEDETPPSIRPTIPLSYARGLTCLEDRLEVALGLDPERGKVVRVEIDGFQGAKAGSFTDKLLKDTCFLLTRALMRGEEIEDLYTTFHEKAEHAHWTALGPATGDQLALALADPGDDVDASDLSALAHIVRVAAEIEREVKHERNQT